jgi:predicted small secreted protein
MKKMRSGVRLAMRAAMFAACVFVAGCATDTGFVRIGQDTYMKSTMGTFTDFSGGVVKARLYKQASEFCSEQGRDISPLGSTSQDSGMATYASAEIQFRCVPK